jgi:hypothetical protein
MCHVPVLNAETWTEPFLHEPVPPAAAADATLHTGTARCASRCTSSSAPPRPAPQTCVVSTLVLLIMLKAQWQHYELLQKMLPKKVIRKLHRRGGMFVESFDNVTILFSDIVSYTSMAATMDPICVVNMLNTVYRWGSWSWGGVLGVEACGCGSGAVRVAVACCTCPMLAVHVAVACCNGPTLAEHVAVGCCNGPTLAEHGMHSMYPAVP